MRNASTTCLGRQTDLRSLQNTTANSDIHVSCSRLRKRDEMTVFPHRDYPTSKSTQFYKGLRLPRRGRLSHRQKATTTRRSRHAPLQNSTLGLSLFRLLVCKITLKPWPDLFRYLLSYEPRKSGGAGLPQISRSAPEPSSRILKLPLQQT
jgi:hypothetical protein